MFCLAVYAATGAKIWGVIANIGAVINLLNLIPVWQLDGLRGFRSLTQPQRMIVLGCAGRRPRQHGIDTVWVLAPLN